MSDDQDILLKVIKKYVLEIISCYTKTTKIECDTLLHYLKILCDSKQDNFLREYESSINNYFLQNIKNYLIRVNFVLCDDIAEKILELYKNRDNGSGYRFSPDVIVRFLHNDFFFDDFFKSGNVLTFNQIYRINTNTDEKLILKLFDLRDESFDMSQGDVESYIGSKFTLSRYYVYASCRVMERLLMLPHILPTKRMLYNAMTYGNLKMVKFLGTLDLKPDSECLRLIVESYETQKNSHDITDINLKYTYVIDSGIRPSSETFRAFVDDYCKDKKLKESKLYTCSRLEKMVIEKGYVPTRDDLVYALNKQMHITKLKKYKNINDIY